MAHESNCVGLGTCALRSLSCDVPLPGGFDPWRDLDLPFPNDSPHYGAAVGLLLRGRTARTDHLTVA